MTISRRTFLAAAVAGTGAAGLATYAVLSPDAPPSTPENLPAPIPSDALRRSFGVNTHLTRVDSPYAATPGARDAVVQLMRQLGAAYWRERAFVEDPLQLDAAQELAAIGSRQVATIGELGDNLGSVSATVRNLERTYGTDVSSIVGAIAGANEPNADGGRWVESSVLHQRAVFEQARRLRALDDVPVLASAVKGDLETAVTDMRALAETSNARWADLGNFHHYTAGQVPTNGLDDRLSAARSVVDGRQAWCTEVGYVDWLGHGPGNPVPPGVYAAYISRALPEMVRRSVPAMIKYELLDQLNFADSWEGHFGLVECRSNDPDTWVEKPAFWALKRLLDLTSDPGAAFSPDSLEGTLTGDVSSMVLAKRNGSYVVLLWRDVSLYDVQAEETISVSPTQVTVKFPRRRDLAWGSVDSPSRSRPRMLSEVSVPVGGSVVALSVGAIHD